jgi:hypothetical protein
MATDTHATILMIFDPFKVVIRRTVENRIGRRASRMEVGQIPPP